MIQQAILVDHTVLGHVGKEPALPEAFEQLPLGKGHDGSELAVLLPVRIQGAAAAETPHRVEHLVLRNFLFILAGRIVLNHAVAAGDHLLLLHQLHICRTEPDHAAVLIGLQPGAHHIPEQPRHLIEVSRIPVIASLKSFNCIIIKKAPQGMGGNDVVAIQNHVPDALAVRLILRRLHIQFLTVTFITLADCRNKNNVAVVLFTRKTAGLTEPDVIHEALTLPYAHGRIHDAKGERLFIVGITVNT